jgi:hypothetical protein
VGVTHVAERPFSCRKYTPGSVDGSNGTQLARASADDDDAIGIRAGIGDERLKSSTAHDQDAGLARLSEVLP